MPSARRRRRAVGVVAALAAVLVGCAIWRLADRWVDDPAARADAALRADAEGDLATGARVISAWLTGAKTDADLVARTIRPWTGRPSQIAGARTTLDSMRHLVGSLDDGVVVLDRRGVVVASTSDRAALVGQSRFDVELPAALAGRVAVSGLVDDPLERVRRVGVVVPLLDAGGHVTGVVAGLTRLPGGSLSAAVARVRGAVVVTSDDRLLDGHGDPRWEREAGTVVVAVGHGYRVVAPSAEAVGASAASEVRRRSVLVVGLSLALGLAAATLLEVARRRAARRAQLERTSFLAVAGHELRTPLALVKGMSAAMSRTSGRSQQAGVSEALERQARALEHRIERLLLAADLRSGRAARPMIRPVDVLPILERSAADLAAASPAHRIEVVADGALWVEGDARALEQIVDNVIENAVRFSPAGGEVRVTARREPGRVIVDVDDEGVGLPSDLDAMFEPFGQRGDAVVRGAEDGGMGLGLFIASTLTGQLGGSIRASRRPVGARMTLSLRSAMAPTD